MKKFTKIFICLMLCVFGFGLVACDKRTPKEKNFVYPSSRDQVIGNDGLAVQKGNYIYFVNGYKSVDDITKKKETYTVGSLLLMKLGEDGQVVTDEDGLLKDEYYITMSSALCGYQATNLHIFGDYLYFVTPCLENESGDTVWAKERVEFKRIKLNKTGKVETVYKSKVKYDQLKYEFYETNNNLYILAWEQGDSYYESNGANALMRINATAKSSSKISNNVSSVVFSDNADEIFFVKDVDSRFELKQYNIAENEITDYTSFDETATAKFVKNGKVYITQSHVIDSTTYTDLKVSTIETKSGFEDFYAFEKGELNITDDGAAVVLVNENVISLIKEKNDVVNIIDKDATTINVIGYTNGCIVYHETTDSKTNIKFVSYNNYLFGGDTEISTLTSVTSIEKDYAYFDLDNSYLFFYQKEGNNYYLNRLKVNNNLGESQEMIGVYLDEDAPKVEEETEEE